MLTALRHQVLRSMNATSGQRPSDGVALVRSMALGLRLRTLLREPYLDPRDLAYADDFELEPSPRQLDGMCPWGGCDGNVIRWHWVKDPRTRGLFVAHGLSEGLFRRQRPGHKPTSAERWALTIELLMPHAFTGTAGPRALSTRQIHAPVWLAQAVAGQLSGVYPRPNIAV